MITDQELTIASKGNMGAIHFGAAWPDKVSEMARELLALRKELKAARAVIDAALTTNTEHNASFCGEDLLPCACPLCESLYSYLARYPERTEG